MGVPLLETPHTEKLPKFKKERPEEFSAPKKKQQMKPLYVIQGSQAPSQVIRQTWQCCPAHS